MLPYSGLQGGQTLQMYCKSPYLSLATDLQQHENATLHAHSVVKVLYFLFSSHLCAAITQECRRDVMRGESRFSRLRLLQGGCCSTYRRPGSPLSRYTT